MFLTRCPACETTFRMTREQLQARDGKVRCGACRHVFTATEHLLETPDDAPAPPAPADTLLDFSLSVPEALEPPAVSPEIPAPLQATEAAPQIASIPVAPEEAPLAIQPPAEDIPFDPEATLVVTRRREVIAPAALEPADEEVTAPPAEEAPVPATTPAKDPIDAALENPDPELSPEELRQRGLEAGLSAPRDLTEIPGFSRWSASPLDGLAPPAAPRILWPFILVSLVLLLVLLLQAAYHFRSEISRQIPATAALYTRLGIEVPLAHQAEWISIEASDLQASNAPGNLALSATLRNRASYPQAWPILELTLTDTYDAVLVRKSFTPAEYLPSPSEAFLPGDTAVRLDLEAGNLRPSGYRLYLYYP